MMDRRVWFREELLEERRVFASDDEDDLDEDWDDDDEEDEDWDDPDDDEEEDEDEDEDEGWDAWDDEDDVDGRPGQRPTWNRAVRVGA